VLKIAARKLRLEPRALIARQAVHHIVLQSGHIRQTARAAHASS
jgi:hypothetical protein